MQVRTAAGAVKLNNALIANADAGILVGVIACLELGAQVDCVSNDDFKATPLLLACKANALDCIQALLAKGANVNAKSKSKIGATALHLAAAQGSLPSVEVLLRYNARVNAIRDLENSTPLHLAIMNSHIEVVTYLLQAGADINMFDTNGYNALHMAIKFSNINMVKLLIDHGADPRIPCRDDNKSTCFDLAQGNQDKINAIHQRIAVQNAKNAELLKFVSLGDIPAIEACIKAGADLNVSTEDVNSSPLHVAIKMCKKPLVDLLLHKGCMPLDLESKIISPLHWCLNFPGDGMIPISKSIVAAMAHQATEQTVNAYIETISTCVRPLSSMALFIAYLLYYPEKYTEAFHNAYSAATMRHFDSDSRREIKLHLLSYAKGLKDPIERKEFVDMAFMTNNALSAMLNTKKYFFTTQCTAEKGVLLEFDKLRKGLQVTKKPAAPAYTEETLADIRNSFKTAIVTQDNKMLEECLGLLRDLYQAHPDEKIKAMLQQLDADGSRELLIRFDNILAASAVVITPESYHSAPLPSVEQYTSSMLPTAPPASVSMGFFNPLASAMRPISAEFYNSMSPPH